MPVSQFAVSKDLHKNLIGKGGSTLRTLQQAHNVKVSIPRAEDTSNVITIDGTLDATKAARENMEDLLGGLSISKEFKSLKVPIQRSFVGSIVGKGGETIKKIQKTSRAVVKIPENSDSVLIEGVPSCVAAAEKMVKDIIASQGVSAAAKPVPAGPGPAKPSTAPINLNAPLVAETLFFPNNGDIERMLAYIRACKKSLDICVFTITDNRIANEIVKAKKRGIALRVITDDDKSDDTGSDILSLSDSGIPVKMDNSTSHMHHKFAILDGVVVMSGSFNWTRSASADNQENIIFTNESVLVHAFQGEFEKLWNTFKSA
eukprot:TRINITY_DN1349_c0_g1_i1.p2 TRINITY_DN1349_c0_g1~~TRINITY_DN1349_c0_g1_i1.p2  ORF type:complete len:317 (-),score=170.03 TRINITY_DN1349_c0_g1_i1:64-1014(-)